LPGTGEHFLKAAQLGPASIALLDVRADVGRFLLGQFTEREANELLLETFVFVHASPAVFIVGNRSSHGPVA
jgi:hypothetical protein